MEAELTGSRGSIGDVFNGCTYNKNELVIVSVVSISIGDVLEIVILTTPEAGVYAMAERQQEPGPCKRVVVGNCSVVFCAEIGCILLVVLYRKSEAMLRRNLL